MKKIVFGAAALLIITQLASTYYLNRRFNLRACGLMYTVCKQGCDAALNDALEQHRWERFRANSDRLRATLACGPAIDDAARACLQESERVFNERMAALDAADIAARETRDQCVAECGRQLHECDASNAAALSANSNTPTATVNTAGTVKVDCIDGGPAAPCFKPVSDFCQHASGACDECSLSFCGAGEWTVDTGNQLPLNTTLVAATDPAKNPRVLATSTPRGSQAVLNVPANIKLGQGEQLYFGFSSTKKPGGPVVVQLTRSK